jgi:hypothetical protein
MFARVCVISEFVVKYDDSEQLEDFIKENFHLCPYGLKKDSPDGPSCCKTVSSRGVNICITEADGPELDY